MHRSAVGGILTDSNENWHWPPSIQQWTWHMYAIISSLYDSLLARKHSCLHSHKNRTTVTGVINMVKAIQYSPDSMHSHFKFFSEFIIQYLNLYVCALLTDSIYVNPGRQHQIMDTTFHHLLTHQCITQHQLFSKKVCLYTCSVYILMFTSIHVPLLENIHPVVTLYPNNNISAGYIFNVKSCSLKPCFLQCFSTTDALYMIYTLRICTITSYMYLYKWHCIKLHVCILSSHLTCLNV